MASAWIIYWEYNPHKRYGMEGRGGGGGKVASSKLGQPNIWTRFSSAMPNCCFSCCIIPLREIPMPDIPMQREIEREKERERDRETMENPPYHKCNEIPSKKTTATRWSRQFYHLKACENLWCSWTFFPWENVWHSLLVHTAKKTTFDRQISNPLEY